MTTIVRTRIPLETLSMSQQPAKRRSERLAAYDEEDGDFVFSRASKRIKTAPAAQETAPAPARTPAPRPKKSKKLQPQERDEETSLTVKKTRSRQMNFSTPKTDQETTRVPNRRRSARNSIQKDQNEDRSGRQNGMETTDYDSIDLIGDSASEEPSKSLISTNQQSTMIALPFSDTPVINRNKELRKKGAGVRRSSLGMRGRRASSLIDNGHSAIPHREVNTKDFYKHIEADGLSEPRRMKQLLTWTGERALGERPSHGDPDSAATLAARVITESLLKDFATNSSFSNWFDREESASVPTKIIKKPNPRNVEIEENLAGLEARIKRLKEEQDQWRELSNPQTPLPPLFSDESSEILPSHIDASFLDPEQAAILATITSSSALAVLNGASEQLRSIQSGLEFKVDQFSDGVHKLEQYQETVGRVADKILALSSVRLAERDRKEKEEIGTRDLPMQEVLRSLSRILPEGDKGL